jgi:hypothetical protein
VQVSDIQGTTLIKVESGIGAEENTYLRGGGSKWWWNEGGLDTRDHTWRIREAGKAYNKNEGWATKPLRYSNLSIWWWGKAIIRVIWKSVKDVRLLCWYSQQFIVLRLIFKSINRSIFCPAWYCDMQLGTKCFNQPSYFVIIVRWSGDASAHTVTRPWGGKPTNLIWFPAGKKKFLFSEAFRRTAGNSHSPNHWEREALSLGIKRRGREPGNLPSPRAVIKNKYGNNSTPQYTLMACIRTVLSLLK